MNNKIKMKIYSIIAASIIAMVPFSKNSKDNSKIISKPSISDKYNDFDDYAQYRLTKAKGELCYKGENIYIFINKETNEITRYIYNEEFFETEAYELDTGDIIYYSPFNIESLSQGYDYYKKLINDSFVFDLKNIGYYLEGENCKKWYTTEELEEIESRLLDFVLTMKSKTKILKK